MQKVQNYSKNVKQPKAGSKIRPSSITNTGANGKLSLRWQDGLFASLGQSSSLSSATGGNKRPVTEIQMIDGIGRFTTDKSATGSGPDYTVSTPMDSIRPEAAYQPVDYIVEVDDPASTILTVLSGKIHVVDRSGSTPADYVYDSCSTVYFSQGKQPQVASVSASDVAKMVDNTTIAGSLPTPETCPTATASVAPPAMAEVAPFTPEYYFDNSYIDFYPYDEIECYPYDTGGYIAALPYIGDWYIPYYYPISPAILQVYVNDYLINQATFINSRFITNVRHRERQFREAIDLASRTDNIGLAARARNRLNLLRTQKNWAEHQLAGLKTRLHNLQTMGRRFGSQVPGGTDLARTIADSFTLPRNADIAKKFQNRLQNQINLEQRMTGLAQNQIDGLKGKLAAVHDPSQRLALRNNLVSMNHNLMQGKIPITAQTKGVSELARQLETAKTPERRLVLQDHMLNQLGKISSGAETAALLSDRELSSLKNQISQLPSSTVRRDLTNKVTSLERATRQTQRQEAMLSNPETIMKAQKQFENRAATSNQPWVMRHNGSTTFQANRLPGLPVQPELSPRGLPDPRMPSQAQHLTTPQVPRFSAPQFRARQFEQPHFSGPRPAQPHSNFPRVQQPHVQSFPQAHAFAPRMAQPHFSAPQVRQPRIQALPQMHASAPALHMNAPTFHGGGPPAPHGPNLTLGRKH